MLDTVQEIKKIDAARRQINAAVLMYFNNVEPLATHTVAAAGLQIVMDLAKEKGLAVGLEEMLLSFGPEIRAQMRESMRHPQNFIKHADRGMHTDVLKYDPDTVEGFVLLACMAYDDYAGAVTPETNAFKFWVCTQNIDILSPGPYRDSLMPYVEEYSDVNTRESKQAVRKAIEQFRIEKPAVDFAVNYD